MVDAVSASHHVRRRSSKTSPGIIVVKYLSMSGKLQASLRRLSVRTAFVQLNSARGVCIIADSDHPPKASRMSRRPVVLHHSACDFFHLSLRCRLPG